MKPNFKSRTPQSKTHFDTTTIGSRFIAQALPWISLILASVALLYLNSSSPKTLHRSNPHQNTPSCPSNSLTLISTPPAASSLSYTPSAPQSCDSTNLLTLSHNITNSISTFLYPTNETYEHQLAYISYKPYALLITTNLTRRPFPCGFCKPSRSIAVPEHINSLGPDLVYSVSIPSIFDF